MRPTEFGREFVYPATHGSVFGALAGFFLLLELAAFGRVFGIFLAALLLPALLRYLMRTLEARIRGRDPGVFDAELLLWFGDVWSLFPVLHVVAMVWGAWLLGYFASPLAATAFLAGCAVVVPASLIVLAVTRSPAESLSPSAVIGVIRRVGVRYAIAPAYVAAATGVSVWLARTAPVAVIADFAVVYLVFAGFAITGGLARPFELEAEVPIPEPQQPDAAAIRAGVGKARRQVLDHAYALSSRGNRAGGLAHIEAWLARDPEPGTAPAWFIEQMLRWENPEAGLALARRRLGRLLAGGREVEAVKLMLRARLVDEGFRPFPEDRARAVAAAERCQHEELASFLR